MQLLYAQPILEQLKQPLNPQKKATLAIVLVGNNPASELYISIKEQQAKTYGVETLMRRFDARIGQTELEKEIKQFNSDPEVNGIIIQLPLPEPFDTEYLLGCIASNKDVDNLTGTNHFTSPMVQSVGALKDYYKLDFSGKNMCLLGHGRLIGKPLEQWLKSQDYNPVVVDESTEDSDFILREADIIFAGSGQKHIINEQNIHSGQIIFDCSGKDVDFEAVKDKIAALSPPKGGIGPLTVHFLFMNVLQAGQS